MKGKQFNFAKWANTQIKNMDWKDIQLIKISVAAFILMVAKIWTPILSLDWYWYLAIFVFAAIRPMHKVLKK